MQESTQQAAGNGGRLRHVTFSCGRRTHGVPDPIVSLDLLSCVDRWVEGDWVLAVVYSDGRGVIMPRDGSIDLPAPSVRAWLAERVTALNVECHSNGHWVIAWRPRAGEAALLFRDGDGDLQVVVDLVPDRFGTPPLMLTNHQVNETAIAALQEQQARIGHVDLSQRQIIKAAQQAAARH